MSMLHSYNEWLAWRAAELARGPRVCPNCLRRVANLGLHLKDTGLMVERPIWSCPVLFQKRNRG